MGGVSAAPTVKAPETLLFQLSRKKEGNQRIKNMNRRKEEEDKEATEGK
jgi:hypothetical protein